MANRLANETSPYLLQHKDNPVDWYPWSPEAFERAKREDKPILLSVGYSACHWCHVMAHESFEDEATAALMNELFVNIKVDREERPDIDQLYMTAVQALTGQGGWPMTVFLTPDGEPFYGGTYFPKEDRYQMPAFRRVLQAVADTYRNRRDDIRQVAQQVLERVRSQQMVEAPVEDISADLLDQAERQIAGSFDSTHGGFGSAPKFPQPMVLEFLLRSYVRTGSAVSLNMVERTLERMARGGIYDQLGGGFHRYSTDQLWLVPHFEKMLYDNAQLALVYLHAYQITGKPLYRQVVEETLGYVIREMLSPEGGFYSAQDADSEGVEGKFFVWSLNEVRSVLDEEEARVVEHYYDVTASGNWEGHNILHVPRDLDVVAHGLGMEPDTVLALVERAKQKLFAHRERRVRPGLDDKVLASWNGLMLQAFSQAAAVLDREDYRAIAERCGAFIVERLQRGERLYHTYKDGEARIDGFLEDYAFVIEGLISLYEATFDLRWIDEAQALAKHVMTHFRAEPGGFFDTSDEAESLISRPRDVFDNATPSGNSAMALTLQRLSALTGDEFYLEPAESYLRSMAGAASSYPLGFGHLLCAIDQFVAKPKEIAIVGAANAPDTRALVRAAFERYQPNRVVAFKPVPSGPEYEKLPVLAYREPVDGKAAAYVCENFMCLAPVTEPADLAAQIGGAG